jgi:threonine dehydrogenase-like Zn-dependent dehydrogenase
MLATLIHDARDIRLETVPDPELATGRDAIVRVVAACVCGSDLWPYRGVTPTRQPHRIGHEFVGVVEAVGDDVQRIHPGDFVIAPFYDCDMTCVNCLNGVSTSCLHGGWWGSDDRDGAFADGGQGELVRVPHADGSLVAVPGGVPDAALVPSLLTLSDVMGTGHHAAVSAGVTAGSTVAVVGDGAVGLCAVLAAKRLGASRIVAMSRHEPRQRLATDFGATDIVAERGDAGVAAIKELTDGLGARSAVEAVGTQESMNQALHATRPGGHVGFVGVAHGVAPDGMDLFWSLAHVHGGPAPVRRFLPELLDLIWTRQIDPGKVFDLHLPLEEAAEGYRAMDQREAIKTLLRP